MTKEEFENEIRVKKWQLKNWWFDTKVKAKAFWDENRDYIVIIGPIVAGIGGEIAHTIARNKRIEEERDLKERYIYDRSLGCYYELKRQPKQGEYLEIDRRKRNGESMGEILKNMRLIK